MSLSRQKKKFIKKNIDGLRIDEIARKLNVPRKAVLEYLQKIWKEDKYEKFVARSAASENGAQVKDFLKEKDLRDWISKNRNALISLGLLAFLVYVNGLGNEFVSDDRYWFLGNPNLGNWSWLLQMPDRVGSWVIFFIAHAIGGLNPLFYRLPNVLFHVGSTLLAFLLCDLLGGRRMAIFTAALFAVHPILVESVTWIAGGSHAQYAFFLILSLLLYILSIQNDDQKFYVYSLFASLLAILFSEKAVVLAGIFFLYELSFGSLSKNWKKLIPYSSLSIASILLQFTKFGGRVTGLATYNYLEPGVDNPLIQIPIAISEYLKLIFWPKDLTLYHSEMSFTWEQYLIRLAVFLLFLAVIAGAFYKSYKSYKTYKFLFFWLSFFVVTLAPTLTPFRISWIVAERYVYLGSLGIFALIGLIFAKLSQNSKLQILVYVLFVLSVLFLSWRTVQRNMDWKNEDNLWIATAKTSPSSPNTHNNLGDVYARHGELKKAAEEFETAIEIKPNYADAYHNLANTQQQLAQQEDSDEYLTLAIANYQKAIELNPNLWQSYQHLGVIYFNQEQYEPAAEEFKKAIEINPTDLNLIYNLGIVYLKAEKKDLAREIFLSILKLDPNNPAVLNALKELE